MSTIELFSGLESRYQLPTGILDAIWAQESSRGKDMLNPASGAAGHFQIMEPNYRAAGIDPNDLAQSAEWTAREARAAIDQFPSMDPVDAIAARHYGGPDTKQWGPRTAKYRQDIAARMQGSPTVPVTPDMGAPDVYGGTTMPIADMSTGPGTLPPVLSQALPEPANIRPGPAQYMFALGDLLRPPGQRTGAMQQLQGLLDPSVQAKLQQQQLKNRLWQQQLGMDYVRLMGGARAGEYQAGMLANQAEQNRLRDLEYKLKLAQFQTPTVPPPDLVERQPVDRMGNPTGMPQWVPEGQEYPEGPEGTHTWVKPGTAKAPEVEKAGEYEKYAPMVGELQGLMTELKNNPQAINTLGTPGRWGAKATAVLGMWDQLSGANTRQQVMEAFFGGKDPAATQHTLNMTVLPVARTMVDKGVLSGPEQARAKALVTLADTGPLSSQQAFELLGLTTKAMARMSGGTLPPSGTVAPPSAPSSRPGGVVDFSDLSPGG